MEQRNLETLIEQFNRASEIDRVSRIATGETYWIEIEGVRTNLVSIWMAELSREERTIFEAYIAQAASKIAKIVGSDDTRALFKDIGQEIFSGLEMGLRIQQQMLSDFKHWIDFDPDEKVGNFNTT